MQEVAVSRVTRLVSDPNEFTKALTILVRSGCSNVPHSDASLLIHLVQTAALLEGWQQSEAVVLAGLCHSLFGEAPAYALDTHTRGALVETIGPVALRLALLFSARGKTALCCEGACGGATRAPEKSAACGCVRLGRSDSEALAHIITANALDQFSRIGGAARPDAGTLARCAPFLSERARVDAKPLYA